MSDPGRTLITVDSLRARQEWTRRFPDAVPVWEQSADEGVGHSFDGMDPSAMLRAMYRTCGFPGCAVRFGDCDVHHVVEWVRDRGPTDLANLLPLCSTHHHLVHEGGWRLDLHADRRLVVRRPDGTVMFDGTTVDVAPDGSARVA